MFDPELLKKGLGVFGGNEKTAGIEEYLDFYGFKIGSGMNVHVGRFSSGEFELAGYLIRPARYKATVLVVHGYLNHCGVMARFASELVKNGYAAALIDLPGHGLSSGKRAGIDDFEQYGRAMVDFAAAVRQISDGPYHVIGHSTGGIAVVACLWGGEAQFEKAVLAAPLVRCVYWRALGLGRVLVPNFARLPRIFAKNSSDKEYLEFVRYSDPLQGRAVPMNWVNAMWRWEAKLRSWKGLAGREVMMIQGDKDSTVDWRYNKSILSKKLAVKYFEVKGADHELLNEGPEIRREVFERIFEYLG